VILILTESVRADASCSDPPPACVSPFLDEVVPDRIALGQLSTQTPSTFSSFLLLTTGLVPTVDFRSAHSAPVLWEVARALGYETAYISAQNPKYEDFGAFTERAGIDVLVTGSDLGGLRQEQLGAPDERATEETLRFVRSVPASRPYFVLMHLSNSHAPYRTDPALLPFLPESTNPVGDGDSFHNHYRNAVRLQERTVAEFLRVVRGLPSWENTVVLFLSDHGEQFFEHGGLYHNHSIWDEELRIPGWIAGGAQALGESQRLALRTFAGRRTFTPDVHATILDLFGVDSRRADLPLVSMVRGRTLLRRYVWRDEIPVLITTSTAVWEPDDAWFGAVLREHALIGALTGPWRCFDTVRDPGESEDLGEGACVDLVRAADEAFGSTRKAEAR
jgi:glucan phosphoethanolaminetransferase (alkaline phosphatase superfamily)